MPLIPKKRRGGPPPKGLERRKHSGTLCTATRRDGQPCTNFSLLGATVCRMHGGGAPQVKRAAQVRLLMAADRLMAQLLQIAEDTKQPAAIRLVAIRDALDRAGLAARQQVEIDAQVSGTVVWEQRIQESIINWGELATGDFNPADAYDDDVEDAVIVQDSDIRRQQRNAEIVEAGKQRVEPPAPRAEQQGGPMHTSVPLSHGETYSERSERQHQEARAREMGLTPRNPGGARSTRAQMGRPKRP